MAAVVAAILLLAVAAIACAYWPGLMTWDSVRQYGQALDGHYDDWHPPAMEWLWRQLLIFGRGPAPMLILQLGLYWLGFVLLAGDALGRRRPGLAAALVACGLLPLSLALMGAVLKDCLMAGALLSATGLLTVARPGRGGAVLRAVAIGLALCAATLRFNAFLACLPLVVALLPVALRDRPLRLAATSIVATAALMLAMPLANRAIGAERSGVELSLIIFDLGGITERSGTDAFPPLGVRDPVAANHGCYSPVKWDPYSNWVDPVCPLGFDAFRAAMVAGGPSPYRLWLAAIIRHPLAYAEHRWAHFNINMRFLVHDGIERPVQVESAPNDWGYRVRPGTLLGAIDGAARATAVTPLGWPIVWLMLAIGALIAGRDLRSRRLIVPIALSAILYGLGYAVFSVAAELRYHLWTMLAAAIALALCLADLAALPAIPWRRVGTAFTPALAVMLLATLWRMLPGS